MTFKEEAGQNEKMACGTAFYRISGTAHYQHLFPDGYVFAGETG